MLILKRISQAILVIAILLAVAYTFRRDPIGPLAGKALTGERMTQTPDDWGFSGERQLAVEVRPEDPHSVTTTGFMLDGALHIPAMNGSEKDWPSIAVADPRVHVKIGERVYPGLATRVTEEKQFEAILASAAKKYPRFEDRPPDLWIFRIEPLP